MDLLDQQTKFELTSRLFQSIRDEYKSAFPGREWDPLFFNFFYPYIKPKPHVVFSWNIEGYNHLVARFEYPWDKNKAGLFNYLKSHCKSLELFEWIDPTENDKEWGYGRVFIKYEIDEINWESLLDDNFYRKITVTLAVQKMMFLEETLWPHVKKFFEKYPE